MHIFVHLCESFKSDQLKISIGRDTLAIFRLAFNKCPCTGKRLGTKGEAVEYKGHSERDKENKNWRDWQRKQLVIIFRHRHLR